MIGIHLAFDKKLAKFSFAETAVKPLRFSLRIMIHHSNQFPCPAHPRDIFIIDHEKRDIPDAHMTYRLLTEAEAQGAELYTPANSLSDVLHPLMLLSWEWWFRTEPALAKTDIKSVVQHLEEKQQLANRLKIWHPRHYRFLLHEEGKYWPVSGFPAMRRLDELDSPKEKLFWWGHMLVFALSIMQRFSMILELASPNFGFVPPQRRLYYLSDHTRKGKDFAAFGAAIIERIAEAPEIKEDQWYILGKFLNQLFIPHVSDIQDWNQLYQGAQKTPTNHLYNPRKKALLRGLINQGNPRSALKSNGKICILADIHSNLPALEAVLEEAKRLGASRFLVLGDLVGYGAQPRECIYRLANLESSIFVQGNHDYAVSQAAWESVESETAKTTAKWTREQLDTESLEWLGSLQREQIFSNWMVVHAFPKSVEYFKDYHNQLSFKESLDYIAERNLQVAFYGHTHIPYAHLRTSDEQTIPIGNKNTKLFMRGEALLINPGSVGQPRHGENKACFALWDTQSNMLSFHAIPYPVDQAIEALVRSDLPKEAIYSLSARLEKGR